MSFHDDMIMALIAEKDRLKVENQSLKRKLIMYRPQDVEIRSDISDVLDRCVAERNELEVQLREAKETIEQLLI